VAYGDPVALKPTARLALVTGLLLLAHIPLRLLLQFSVLLFERLERDAAAGAALDEPTQVLSGLAGGGVCCLYVPVFIATIVCFCMFVHRASKNLLAAGVERPQHTPGMAVGWFFIPLANLVMPYRVVQDLWEISGPGTARERAAGWILAWWACWITGNLLDNAGNLMARLGNDVDDSLPFQALLFACWAAAALFGWQVVLGLDRRVTARVAARAAAAESPPPLDGGWR